MEIENKLKYLELIQSVINRMASNSFMLKGWAVTLVTGIFALVGKGTDKLYFLIAYIPVIAFGDWMHIICFRRDCIGHCMIKLEKWMKRT